MLFRSPKVVSQDRPAPRAEARSAAPQQKTGFLGLDKNKIDSISDALLAAGFGMMAGRSTNAFQNIGMGGLKGIEAYQAAEAIRARRDAEQAKILEKRAADERSRKYLESFVGRPSAVSADKTEEDALYNEIDRLQSGIAAAPDTATAARIKAMQEGVKMKLQRLKDQEAATSKAATEKRLAHEKSPEGIIEAETAKDIAKQDRKSTRLNSSHVSESRMPSSA